MAVNKQRLLVGWRAIAEHLDWSVARVVGAQTWDPPIPVRKVGDWFEADADDLDRWREAGSTKTGTD